MRMEAAYFSKASINLCHITRHLTVDVTAIRALRLLQLGYIFLGLVDLVHEITLHVAYKSCTA